MRVGDVYKDKNGDCFMVITCPYSEYDSEKIAVLYYKLGVFVVYSVSYIKSMEYIGFKWQEFNTLANEIAIKFKGDEDND